MTSNETILVPDFSDKLKLQGKTFSEWFNEPAQLKTRKRLVKAIKKENEEYIRKVDQKIINMLSIQTNES